MTRIIAGVAGGRRLAVPPGRATRPTSDRAREGLFGTVQAMLESLHGARVMDLYAGSGAVGLEALSRGAAHALLVESAPAAIRVIKKNIAALDLPGACLAPERVERLLARGPANPPGAASSAPGSPSAAASLSAPKSASTTPVSPSALGPPSAPDSPSAPGFPPASVPGSPPGSPSGWCAGAGGGFGFAFADPPYAVGDGEVAAMLRALREHGWLAEGALVAVERRTGDTPFAWPPGYVADRARRYGDATLWYGLAAGA